METIETHVRELSEFAKDQFAEHGLLEPCVVKRREHGPIFNINANDDMFRRLSEQDVVCSQRGGGIRLSFHFYNTKRHINDIVKILITGS